MLATVIPFFLLASVQEENVWPNGPEIKFTSKVDVTFTGWKETMVQSWNGTNEILCRPKEENIFSCQFKHVGLVLYESKTSDRNFEFAGMINGLYSNYLESFPFEIGFNNKGVNKIVVNRNVSEDLRLGLTKSLANLMNVGVDLDKLQVEQNGFSEMNQMNNLLLGVCNTNLQVGYVDDPKEANEGTWNLELASPLKKLSGRAFNILKSWNVTDCNPNSAKYLYNII